MAIGAYAAWMLAQEARSLLTRLARLEPFALIEPTVLAAALMPSAQSAIESQLVQGRRELRRMVAQFQHWLRREHADGASMATAAEAQRRFTFLRLKFNAALTQFDLFNEVITQRSEHKTGVWLAGLDIVAADALALPGNVYQAPPVICYLDRGPGAAIRRARTRLPGGGDNPVAIIRLPRERMIGSSIASSLVHEVGHQGAALLDLVASLRPVLQAMQHGGSGLVHVWQLWERWISEIVADFWSLARVGVAATLGLIGVVSLPRVFVFRLNIDDPHPVPWLRVRLSCAMGRALYPHPQWDRLEQLWLSYYPLTAAGAAAGQHGGPRGLAGAAPATGLARRLAGRSHGRAHAPARHAGAAVSQLDPGAGADVPGRADPGVRRAGPGARQRYLESGRRKRAAGAFADPLGLAQHPGHVGAVRRRRAAWPPVRQVAAAPGIPFDYPLRRTT
ncbi:hypothetical protein JAB5_51570 [Janthinobacterium sp. HH103]|uniref:hypothetical protein n=1 Tax=Janthinobacterium sp. HH103 TaxID=1537275 RepID=UPI00089349C1|nr:hypothetical protein [Janthinobacterium sp. HH103]OEZ68102.1 hypothetical protein JAB5_51570 [Janthinobacterium sp. HH103]